MGVSQNSVHQKWAERYKPPPSILVVFHTFWSVTPMAHKYVLRMTHIATKGDEKNEATECRIWETLQNNMVNERANQYSTP